MYLFRCTSIFSIYPGQPVCPECSDMEVHEVAGGDEQGRHGGRHGGGQGGRHGGRHVMLQFGERVGQGP